MSKSPSLVRRLEKLTKYGNNCSLGMFYPNVMERRLLKKAAQRLFKKDYVNKDELRYTLHAMVYAALLDRERSVEEILNAVAEARLLGVTQSENFANRLYLAELEKRAPTSRGGFTA